MHIGEFNDKGEVIFTEVRPKPPDPRRLQSAMFMDRPDLWRKPSRNGRKPPPKEQLRMFTDPAKIHLGLPPKCIIEEHGSLPDPAPKEGWGE